MMSCHQHYYLKQDLLENPKCSLLVARDPEDRTDLVITIHGDAVGVSLAPDSPIVCFF